MVEIPRLPRLDQLATPGTPNRPRRHHRLELAAQPVVGIRQAFLMTIAALLHKYTPITEGGASCAEVLLPA